MKLVRKTNKEREREREGEIMRECNKKAKKVIKCQSKKKKKGIDKQGNSRGVLNCNQY